MGFFGSTCISLNYRRFPLSIIENDQTFKIMQLDRLIDLDIISHGSDASGFSGHMVA